MATTGVSEKSANVRVENIGGIDETEVSFEPGVTVLTGRNATNRTSFLQAVMAALGSENAALKGDADDGHVELTFDGETYTRHLTRRGDTVAFEGDPYLDDSTVADLFAFLLETNEARRAIAYDEDLRDLIMEPVDTEAIEREIERLEAKRRDVEEELEELEELEQRLPTLEERRLELEDEIEEKRAEYAELQAEIDAADSDLEEKREEKAEIEAKFEELNDARSDLESVRSRIETQRETIQALEDQRDDLREELDSTETETRDVEAIDDELDRVRDQKRRLDSEINDLQDVISFNQEMLEGANQEVLNAIEPSDGAADDGPITDQLLESSESTVCWTCGTAVNADQIEETIDRLRELRQTKVEQRRELEDELDGLKSEKDTIQTRRERRRSLERQMAETEEELQERREKFEELDSERERLIERVEALEEEANALEDETEGFEELRELHREATETEVAIENLESDLDGVRNEIASIEDRLDSESHLRSRKEETTEELTELRTRIERLEQETVERFNEHMSELLDVLGYENVERIWLERVKREVREGRRKVERSAFELHVVRTTNEGASYEDRVDHLSESEREVTGLVFALAGYLAHDVHETQPFMMLDSLEAIDAERIALLIEYFEQYADYLLVALLPEDADALDGAYQRVSEI